MIQTKTSAISLIAASVTLAIFSNNANAAAFGIIEQSVTGLGTSFSTGSTAATDGSTLYFNPAGMSSLKNRNAVTFGANIIDPNAKFKDQGSTHVTTANLNVNNENGGDAGPVALVPNFYYTRAINSQWTAGVGINAPFGLTTDYEDGWVGRYHTLRSELKTVNINPSISYKASDTLNVAFGISAQYIDVTLTNAVDFGTIFAGAGRTPQGDDGEVIVKGDDWGYGYNAGLLWQASPQTRIGVAYRSRIKYKLEGDADFRSSAAISAVITAAGGGLFVDSNVTGEITVPDNLSIGFQHQINNKLTVNGDFTWTNWSLVEEIRFVFENTLQPDGLTTIKLEDSNRYSLGMTYQQNEKWTWRTGIAFDESATPNAELISVRIPDADRTWLSAGFTYKASNKMNIDFAFAHLFIKDANVRKTASGEDRLKGGLVGKFDIDANILSAQARWSF